MHLINFGFNCVASLREERSDYLPTSAKIGPLGTDYRARRSIVSILFRSSERGRRQGADAVEHRGRRDSAARGGRKQRPEIHAANLHPDEARAQTVVVREPVGAVHGAAGATGLRQAVLR